ncbi:MAG: bifunctional folylpolyglutamate synthase/dihydrofolate synthase [Prevotellaceae bacterium]|nr:bifunctional folylpolyglutamate synthase/dihydrofolate synthase [Prevotellaceae bacterium]
MDYKKTIQYLYEALPVFHRIGKAAYKANLDNSMLLDGYFGTPHKKYKTIHVAGTNGKGSVAHIIASTLHAAGYKTGLYTSPHLFDFRERIKIDGQEIPEQKVIDFVNENKSFIEKMQPSFFEITSSMAFWFFAEERVDVAVIETGLGGRLDSTNIITPELSVITNIGFDHTEFLGDSLDKIACEKAGIIKPDIPVVVGEKHEQTTGVFIAKANEANSRIFFAEDCLKILTVEHRPGKQSFTFASLNSDLFPCERFTVSLDLEGNYQSKNIVTALTALAVLGNQSLEIGNEAIQKGLANAAANTGFKGRWQILQRNPTIVCDTGHNAHGLKLSMQQLKEQDCENLFFVLGVSGDKDLDDIIPLLPENAYYFFTQASIPRAMDAEMLAKQCLSAGLHGEVVATVSEAVQKATEKASANDVIFIGGSTYVVAEIVEDLEFETP